MKAYPSLGWPNLIFNWQLVMCNYLKKLFVYHNSTNPGNTYGPNTFFFENNKEIERERERKKKTRENALTDL